MGGSYGDSSTQTTFSNSRGVTITSYPGQPATVNGYPLVTGTGTRISNINFDVNNTHGGTHCAGETQGAYSLQIEASNVILDHNNIYQTDVPYSLRAVGIGVGWNTPVSGVVISDNRIHDFGHCQDLDHGIYVDQASGTQIFGNWIYNIPAGSGIQLYPHPQGSHVYGNVIDHAGIGFFLGDEYGVPASNNQIDHNVISNSTGLPSIGMGGVAISTYWGGSVGTGNVFATNDSFNNPSGTTGGSNGVTVSGTSSGDPQYYSTSGNDYRVASTSPVASWGLWDGDQAGSSSTVPPTPPPVLTAPAIPSGVSTTGGDGHVSITWAANAVGDQVSQYNVYRTDQTFTGAWATPTTTFTNTGSVVNGTQYCYQVSATNAIGESAKSAPVCATPQAVAPTPPPVPTPQVVPSIPSGLRATASARTVVLTWTANPARDTVKHYNVYRTNQTFTGPWATPTATTFTTTSNIAKGKKYCYQLSATNNTGESAKTAPACTQTPRATITRRTLVATQHTICTKNTTRVNRSRHHHRAKNRCQPAKKSHKGAHTHPQHP